MVGCFRVCDRDPSSRARSGILRTSHGLLETPLFMPVGTLAGVKAMPHEFLEQLEVSLILGNTYHLYLRPGHELIKELGGLHRFMSWNGAILTDSGGYQVFSHQALRRISDEGVEFQSHLDGSSHFFSPEKSIEIQEALGADVIMAFDECTPYPVTEKEARESMQRSMLWARRCREVHSRPEQLLFGIVQGSVFQELREESLEKIQALDFAGIAIGGLSVGEPKALMYEVIEGLAPLLDEERPHYLMGVGTPLDLFFAVRNGMDMFDCVLPTRNARNGSIFTSSGKISIKNSQHRDEAGPLDPNCSCFVCRRYSRAYLRHLFLSGEIASSVLNTYHNLHFYLDLMRKIRESIRFHSLEELEQRFRSGYESSSEI
ncbi:MAG: tRNA guanosine(34) transglycosylase Tgt [Acidobacteria bacterium]|nr:tRNA guanosine(34) transglycosylase Tgt [Acidobacteriota bacterium]